MPEAVTDAIDRIAALANRLRTAGTIDAGTGVTAEIARLTQMPGEAAILGGDLRLLLAMPYQSALYAEAGVPSAMGFWLELMQRLGQRWLPPAPDNRQLRDILRRVFRDPRDYRWVAAVPDDTWIALAKAIDLGRQRTADLATTIAPESNLLDAVRLLSYRLAGAALDRELLRADPALERHESPFLAQNAALVPALERARAGGTLPDRAELSVVSVMLDQCDVALARVRRRAAEAGISIRLTYLLARLGHLVTRLRELLDLAEAADTDARLGHAVRLMKTLVTGEQSRHRIAHFIGTNVSLLARNVTDHASRHGEHYIAEHREAWWAMARSAAGGGVIIACMALLKIRLALLHLPPLTEGVAYGINYGMGFVLIHLLGFSVATKQPAMTAASIAATLEEAHPRELEKLGDLVQNVARTQFVAVLGNVGLALPVACLIALAWQALFDTSVAPAEKALLMLHEVHPLASGALFFAAIAGVGLFLSGLVSGYFDNQARYHAIAPRITAAPALAWLGPARSARLGSYLDEHYGAILGNLFFGMYLGMVGALGSMTGLPVDIRHVAFSSANLGTALVVLDGQALRGAGAWAAAGVAAIALVNLAVSFALALYVAMKSRRLGALQIVTLGTLMLRRFTSNPWAFFMPPPPQPNQPPPA
jgi:site-specific recombinase